MIGEEDGLYWMRGWLYVLDVATYPGLCEYILCKVHYTRFTVHPGSVTCVDLIGEEGCCQHCIVMSSM